MLVTIRDWTSGKLRGLFAIVRTDTNGETHMDKLLDAIELAGMGIALVLAMAMSVATALAWGTLLAWAIN